MSAIRGAQSFRQRFCIGLGILAFLCVAQLGAQVDPRGKARTFVTEHFRVHFPAAYEYQAQLAAAQAEYAWGLLADELPAPSGRVDLLLADNTDQANGFAQVTPSKRIVIYMIPPVLLSDLRFHDYWYKLVITHELAHIFHLDMARGLWRLGRYVFGRNPALFPNSLTPGWVKEGLAVHFESRLTGSGRIVSTESHQLADASARGGFVPGPDAWSESSSRFPGGQMAYSWGSLLMHREAVQGGDSSMLKFMRATAGFPIPFLLDRAAKQGFGKSFTTAFRELRDSINLAVSSRRVADSVMDAEWQVVGNASGNYYAAWPRWRGNDTLEWTASNGREVAGLYRAAVPVSPAGLLVAERVTRRNSLDLNTPTPDGGSVFSQIEFANPYEVRSDLYRRDATGKETRLTHGARMVHPDVRVSDGTIVAVQLHPHMTMLARFAPNGEPFALRTEAEASYAEPRWSPDGRSIAAVEVLVNGGEQRIVLLDTMGAYQRIVASTRGVMSSPTFSPDGRTLVWASDRSGSLQLEAAAIPPSDAPRDTVWRASVRQLKRASSGVAMPVVSPDGKRVAALLYRANGYVVGVAPLTLDGPEFKVADAWYPLSLKSATGSSTAHLMGFGSQQISGGTSRPYRAWRQLIPTYWQPVVGTARDGGSSYGGSTESHDIRERHAYATTVLFNPREKETDAAFAYRYAGFGRPLVDFSASQDWDATFQLTDSAGSTLGFVARRRQFVTTALSWSVPRVRWSASGSLGMQYELRHFTATVDSLLGGPGSLLRTGTRYPSVFASAGFGNLARGALGISAEQGLAVSSTVSYRQREGAGGETGSWRSVGSLRAFQALPLPGFARHVIAVRIAGGVTDNHAITEFGVGGISGTQTELLPGVIVGDPSRTFPVRGFAPSAQRGLRAIGGTVEYRAPLTMINRGAGLFPVFLNRFSLNGFVDAARAWCPSDSSQRVDALCERVGHRDGTLASAGGELVVDLAFQYDVPYRFRFGFARPIAAPVEYQRKPLVYFTLGSFF